MERIVILLEDPKYAGNIGMVCRLVANFDLLPLRVIGNKRDFHFEMEWMAHNAEDELEKIQYFSSPEEALKDLSVVIGTGMIQGKDRGPFLKLSQLPSIIKGIPDKIGILFGREDNGMSNHCISLCNYMIDFELNGKQPSMNLSHSVAYTLSVLYNFGNSDSGLVSEDSITPKFPMATEKNDFYKYAKKVFEILGMNEFHGNENLATKRLKNILESRPLSQGDIGFMYKLFRNIERISKSNQ